jgi:hypothetical protein
MAQAWYYARGTDRVGPLSLEQLRAAAAGGALRREDVVWADGMPEWVPAGSRPELFGDAAGPHAPAVAAAPAGAAVMAAAPVAQRAAPVGYYVATGDMPGRAAATLRRHAPPTGDVGDWPLDDARVAVFRDTMKLRKKVMSAAQLYKGLFALTLIAAVVLALALAAGGSRGAGRGGGSIGILALGIGISLAFLAGIAVLYAVAWRATLRSQRWAPITLFVLFMVGAATNVLGMAGAAAGRGDPGAMVGNVIGIVLAGLFAAVSWGAIAAIPRYRAQPAWCQELIAASDL